MPNQVAWPKCNVFDKDGNATTLNRGEYLPDDVDSAQVETLMVIGAVKPVEYAPEPRESDRPTSEQVEDQTPELLQKPSPDDSKTVWVAYASDERNPNRISESAANSMSKQALVDRFK